MKIFVLGKRGSVVHWTEDSIAGFRAAGHDVRFGVTRNPMLNPAIERLLLSPRVGSARIVRILRAIRRFAPDLIIAIGPYGMPLAVLQQVAATPNRPPLVGWVGDLYAPTDSAAAGLLDAVAYTDSGLLALHNRLGFQSPAFYLPHAANPRLHRQDAAPQCRRPQMAFVANPTRQRQIIIDGLDAPMVLYGPGWPRSAKVNHEVHARRIGISELATVYRSHLAALNIHNEVNVMDGLNQRHFDPYLAGTPVVSDAQADLPLCFDPGHEMLVYRDAAELNDIYARLRRQPDLATVIGENGRKRILAQHSYGHRLESFAQRV